jgi:SepF-like predicted cell division protein (DUF552 family)
MKFLREIFKSDPELYSIQRNSIQLNKDIFNLIVKTEKILDDLKIYLTKSNISLKEAKLAEFENSLLNIKSKIDALRLDAQRILDVELKHKDYILLNDDFYLKDKLYRVDSMSQVVEELLDLISEKPAINELKDMLNYIYSRMNILVDSVNSITGDDKHLEEVYSRLRDL